MDQVNQMERNLVRQEELCWQQHHLNSVEPAAGALARSGHRFVRSGYRACPIFLGSLDTADQIRQLEGLLEEEAPETIIQTLDSGEDNQRCIIATWRPRSGTGEGHLRRLGFNPLPLQGENGTPHQIVGYEPGEAADIESELAQLAAESLELAAKFMDFEILHDFVSDPS